MKKFKYLLFAVMFLFMVDMRNDMSDNRLKNINMAEHFFRSI